MEGLESLWELQAVEYFLAEFVVEAPTFGHRKGYLSGLTTLMSTLSLDSALRSAVVAASLAHMASRMENVHLTDSAANHCLQALERLQILLRDPDKCISAEAVTAVHLLGLYDITSTQSLDIQSHSRHLRGLVAILKARCSRTGKCGPGVGFFMTLHDDSALAGWQLDHDEVLGMLATHANIAES